MDILHLTLKRKWFDMILADEKQEEYRDIKDYWAIRLVRSNDSDGMEWGAWCEMLEDMRNPYYRHNGPEELMRFFNVRFRHFDAVRFRNGYAKDAPEFMREFNGITIQRGKREWGALSMVYYFTIKLGCFIGD